MKLHIGCGKKILDGYVNVDMRDDVGADYVIDALLYMRNLVQIRAEPVDEIYASHFLEHLNKHDGREFISLCATLLQPGGILRLDLPLVDFVINDCWKGGHCNQQAIINILYGIQRYPGDQHNYGYTLDTLNALLVLHGFELIDITRGREGKPDNKNSAMTAWRRVREG